MGHIIDMIIDPSIGKILGLVVPGEKRFFKKTEDFVIPLEKVRRIGDDVILVRVDLDSVMGKYMTKNLNSGRRGEFDSRVKYNVKNGSFIRYRKLDNKKYK